jgi:predicted transcriptional regulator
MLTIEEIRKKLEDRNLKLVSERSGVPYQVVLRVANGTNTNPAYNTTKAISDYLESI